MLNDISNKPRSRSRELARGSTRRVPGTLLIMQIPKKPKHTFKNLRGNNKGTKYNRWGQNKHKFKRTISAKKEEKPQITWQSIRVHKKGY